MPNGGFDGSIEEWEKMEAPLLEIDEILAEFVVLSGPCRPEDRWSTGC